MTTLRSRSTCKELLAARRRDPAPQRLVRSKRREHSSSTATRRFPDLRRARVGRQRARAHAQGSDDSESACRARRQHRHARGHPRSRLGIRGLPVDAHGRQLHRAAAQALRAQSRATRALPHGARRRLSLHARAEPTKERSRDDEPALQSDSSRADARRPLWIMRQAGRYLPEYRAFRKAHSFKDLAKTPSSRAEVTLMPLRAFRSTQPLCSPTS